MNFIRIKQVVGERSLHVDNPYGTRDCQLGLISLCTALDGRRCSCLFRCRGQCSWCIAARSTVYPEVPLVLLLLLLLLLLLQESERLNPSGC